MILCSVLSANDRITSALLNMLSGPDSFRVKKKTERLKVKQHSHKISTESFVWSMIDSLSDGRKSYLLKINYFLFILGEEEGTKGSQSFTFSIFHKWQTRCDFHSDLGHLPRKHCFFRNADSSFSQLTYFPPVMQHQDKAKTALGTENKCRVKHFLPSFVSFSDQWQMGSVQETCLETSRRNWLRTWLSCAVKLIAR